MNKQSFKFFIYRLCLWIYLAVWPLVLIKCQLYAHLRDNAFSVESTCGEPGQNAGRWAAPVAIPQLLVVMGEES